MTSFAIGPKLVDYMVATPFPRSCKDRALYKLITHKLAHPLGYYPRRTVLEAVMLSFTSWTHLRFFSFIIEPSIREDTVR